MTYESSFQRAQQLSKGYSNTKSSLSDPIVKQRVKKIENILGKEYLGTNMYEKIIKEEKHVP